MENEDEEEEEEDDDDDEFHTGKDSFLLLH